jgi:hypothetical protein
MSRSYFLKGMIGLPRKRGILMMHRALGQAAL